MSVVPWWDRGGDLDCHTCAGHITPGTAHVVLHGIGAGRHALYHPDCCPGDHGPRTLDLSLRLFAELEATQTKAAS